MSQHGPVVVLGANGKLGRILRRHWQGRADVLWQARYPAPGINLVWQPGQDWTGPARVAAVVALWGVLPGKGDLTGNVTLALAAAELGHARGAGRVLHCSSAGVYAAHSDPRAEADADPQSAYGRAKLAMEQAVLRAPAGPVQCCLRLANVAGADSLFASLDRGGPVTLDRFPDGQGPRRSYLGHAALAQVIDAALGAPADSLPGVVNVANAGEIAMADLVRAAGHDLLWRPAPDGAAARLTLDTARLKMLCDPGPTTPDDLVADWRDFSGGPR